MVNSVNNPAHIEILNSGKDLSGAKRINDIKLQTDPNLFERLTTQEQKNTIVSEQLDDNSSLQNYNLQFQPNTPLAKPAKKEKTFNETHKPEKEKFFSSDVTETDELENEEYQFVPDELTEGRGYYLVLNDQSQFEAVKQLQSPHYRIQENLKRIYQQGFRKSPGTLVNLTY
ncbi:MAG: hypothetical protein V1720_08575 [bacterium]